MSAKRSPEPEEYSFLPYRRPMMLVEFVLKSDPELKQEVFRSFLISRKVVELSRGMRKELPQTDRELAVLTIFCWLMAYFGYHC